MFVIAVLWIGLTLILYLSKSKIIKVCPLANIKNVDKITDKQKCVTNVILLSSDWANKESLETVKVKCDDRTETIIDMRPVLMSVPLMVIRKITC